MKSNSHQRDKAAESVSDSSPREAFRCRGVRGAICVKENNAEEILRQTRRLFALMIRTNGIVASDIAGAFLTATPDLTAGFPAQAARQLGFEHVPLMCAQEMNVQDALPRCIRVMILWNTVLNPDQIQNVYLGEAKALRPDEESFEPIDWEELDCWIAQRQTFE